MDRARALSQAERLQLLASAEQRTVHFHGESMRPFLQDGDGLVVRPVPWEDIRIGDIVTYRAADKLPARRVVWKGARRLLLWCENWPERYFRADRDDVLGRVVARERQGVWLDHRQPPWRRATRRALIRFCAAAPAKGMAWSWSRIRRRIASSR
jgi:hypothetical protein